MRLELALERSEPYPFLYRVVRGGTGTQSSRCQFSTRRCCVGGELSLESPKPGLFLYNVFQAEPPGHILISTFVSKGTAALFPVPFSKKQIFRYGPALMSRAITPATRNHLLSSLAANTSQSSLEHTQHVRFDAVMSPVWRGTIVASRPTPPVKITFSFFLGR